MLLLLGCAQTNVMGDWRVVLDAGSLTVAWQDDVRIRDLRFGIGEGDEAIDFNVGAYKISSGESTFDVPTISGEGFSFDLGDGQGTVTFSRGPSNGLLTTISGGGNRVRFDAACTGNDHIVGGGEHAFDVDHVGEAFDLWVSEPGVGKVDSEEPTADWFLTGTRHASSYPDPFFLRPEPLGIVALTNARVSVDLCTDDRWTLDTWQGESAFLLLGGIEPIDIVRAHATLKGPPAIAPDWALAPWNDAVHGQERVRTVASELRTAGAPSSVIWTEDWKGGEESSVGYRILSEWDVDRTLYPDAESVDGELEAAGFKWFAYFSPFLVNTTRTWKEASQFAITDDEGAPYLFTGVTFEPTTVLDLTRADAIAWAAGKMNAAVDVGFDGWMADYAEWLPTDAHLDGADALDAHNAYPGWWQAVSADVLADHDAAFFTRSGWTGSPSVAPIHWPGDQRTSFDADDGLPSVVSLFLGGSIAGIPLTGSDIAGYQSIGNAPSTKELWFRWCALGAFSPVMRTHHGAFAADNWQFDSDAETLAFYAEMGQEHVRLFPYLRGLLAEAERIGTPLVRPIFLHYPSARWGRTDAYLLGPSILVAPVLTAGIDTLAVDLPSETRWWDWWTGAETESSTVSSPLGSIPVFATDGAVIPLFATAPDSLVPGPLAGVRTLSDVDAERIVRVYGGAGAFTEADGTVYLATGRASANSEATEQFASGRIAAGGITLDVSGTTTRTYTLRVMR